MMFSTLAVNIIHMGIFVELSALDVCWKVLKTDIGTRLQSTVR